MFRHGQPHAHSADSPQWIAPRTSAFGLEGEEAKRSSCPVSHLPAKCEAEETKAPKISSLKESSVRGKLSNNLHLSDAGDQVMVHFLLAIFFLRAETKS